MGTPYLLFVCEVTESKNKNGNGSKDRRMERVHQHFEHEVGRGFRGGTSGVERERPAVHHRVAAPTFDTARAGFKKIVDVHKKKSRASVVVGDVKFICAVSNEDFTFWTFSGELGGIQKPVLMCSSANTCSVIALFKTRGGNVNHVANVVELLKKGNA